ncbi:hypothetical protein [Sinorhizobium meliloti]|uniref:hypothetical protein n=1 Tax=Rhizobium meliloti TaxID=382 RepID=UPI0012FD8C72|nr:hypothetical protein [Sinorhizobium meliloti]
MPTTTSSKPWKKYAAYPGQPSFLPRTRYQCSTWQELIQVVADAEAANEPRELRACGSHWAFSDTAVSPIDIVETNDPDERDNPAANRLNKRIDDLLPRRLSERAARFFEGQKDVKFQPNAVSVAVAVEHVQAGIKVAELYSLIDNEGISLANRYVDYEGPWAMETLGGAGGQTICGATQTATHGGDVVLAPIADAIVAVHLIGANGRHYWIEKTGEPWDWLFNNHDLEEFYPKIRIMRNNDMLRAVQVAAGRFGIIHSMVLKLVRQYSLFEDRTASTWSAVQGWLNNPGVVGASRFTQIVVNPIGRHGDIMEHSAWVSRRWRLPLSAAGNPPAGRAERSGANAAREVPFDPNDPDARDSFLNRLCEGAGILEILIDKISAPIEGARDKALITAGLAQASIAAAGLIGLPPPPFLVYIRDTALGVAIAAQATLALLAVVRGFAPGTVHVNEALGDISNFLAEVDQLWILRLLSDMLMGSDQKPRAMTAISYAVMDIHNYRDWVCSKNGDSIEVFFSAWSLDAINFLNLLFARVRQLEAGMLPETNGERMAFPGYVAIRFTGKTGALIGMQRWNSTVSIEIASINACKGTAPLLARVHQDALEAIGAGVPLARIHWGQKNTVPMRHVEAAYDAWVPGGDLALWRQQLSLLTRNGRDSVFSTAFTRQAGLEVVQPLVGSFAASPDTVCAHSTVDVSWEAENNPKGTVARLQLKGVTPVTAEVTIASVGLKGAMQVPIPPGQHELALVVEYGLNGRTLSDRRALRVRGVTTGDLVTFVLEATCGSFSSVNRWWVDINMGGLSYSPDIQVEALKVISSTGGSWRLRRSGKPDMVLTSATSPLPVADRPPLHNSSWRFLSEATGCTGPVPTLTFQFTVSC